MKNERFKRVACKSCERSMFWDGCIIGGEKDGFSVAQDEKDPIARVNAPAEHEVRETVLHGAYNFTAERASAVSGVVGGFREGCVDPLADREVNPGMHCAFPALLEQPLCDGGTGLPVETEK